MDVTAKVKDFLYSFNWAAVDDDGLRRCARAEILYLFRPGH